MRWALLPLLLLLALPSSAIRLSGQLYELGTGSGLVPARETLVVKVEDAGSVAGRAVSSGGTYLLELGAGDYRLSVLSPRGEVRASENVSLRGDTRLDLILLPSLDLPDLPGDEGLLANLTLPARPANRAFPWLGVAVGAGAAGSVALWLRHRRRGGAAPPSVPGTLPEDLQAVVRVLEQEGGRMTQKELRRRLGHSEAKVSLMVADLQNRGRVQKFKVGRGNVVVLEGGSPPPESRAGTPQSDEKGREGS